jgi:hypothetical protein
MFGSQGKRRASLQVAESAIRRNFSLQNGMDVIRPNMQTEQMPATVLTGSYNRVQNKPAVSRPKSKLGLQHELRSLLAPSHVGLHGRSSPVPTNSRYRARFRPVQVRTISRKGEQDSNRFAHGSKESRGRRRFRGSCGDGGYGWDGGACAGPWLRSGGCARGSRRSFGRLLRECARCRPAGRNAS